MRVGGRDQGPVGAADPVEVALRGRRDRVLHREVVPARTGQRAAWPTWADPGVVAAMRTRGIDAPWRHQVLAADLAHDGRDVVLATPAASGKSLAYLLPVLTALREGATALDGRGATALYLSPTKALAADQLAAVDALGLDGVRAATYDGDTPTEQRRWVRRYAGLVLTNPDLLHRSLLPGHERWASFLRRLRYVVVDECHQYRGVFGSHVALVLRRLRRVAARYGADPVLVLASATSADPAASASRLVGSPVTAVSEDASQRPATTFLLWEPPLRPGGGEGDAPTRRSALAETADLLADLVAARVRTLAFVRSRRGAESVAIGARRVLAERDDALPATVAAYRGGYLPEERRALESDLRTGRLLGVATTSALELGIDVSGLDAVLMAGWPGTRASMWQQAGRAGRRGTDALAVLVARDDPLDTYLVHHPQALFGRPVEATVLDPTNPYVLAPHLCAAAAELPLTESDLPLFATWAGPAPGPGAGPSEDEGSEPAEGGSAEDDAVEDSLDDGEDAAPEGVAAVRSLLDVLVERRALRRRPAGWFWTRTDDPAALADLRGSGGEPVRVVEARTGRVLGTVDDGASHHTVHAGAVYVHQGVTCVVDSLDLQARVALVHREETDWTTQARETTQLDVVSLRRHRDWGQVRLSSGQVDVTSQVTSYLRRGLVTGTVLGEEPLDLPSRRLRTTAVWWTVPDDVLAAYGLAAPDVPGAAHAAEHAAIGLLPLVATCDRWDVGGLSTAMHPDTGMPTVFVHDGHPGGAGFAERGYAAAGSWLRATADAILACECASGCPSCVQSPKCGNGNEPLDKAGAVRFLAATLASAGAEVVLPDGPGGEPSRRAAPGGGG